MGTEQYETILSELISLGVSDKETIKESDARLNKVMAIADRMATTVEKSNEKHCRQMEWLEKELQACKQERKATLERCDVLLGHNRDLMDHIKHLTQTIDRKDEEVQQTRERFDRLMDLLESALLSGRSQPSSATVQFTGMDAIKH